MQYTTSRQDVTGLVTNAKVNTRSEYRHTVRAMVHRLLNTGSFQIKRITHDNKGNPVESEEDGTLEQLNGMLSFIDSVRTFRKKKITTKSKAKKKSKDHKELDGNEKTYRQFLLFRNFYAASDPLVVCEGKTDNIYLKAAIKRFIGVSPTFGREKKEWEYCF